MGSGQSVRASHFQRPNSAADEPLPESEDSAEDHHISISNKMVEHKVLEDLISKKDEEECMEWLRCSSDDYALCAEKWEKTNKLRKQRVHSNEKASYLQEFPCLKRSFGYELIERLVEDATLAGGAADEAAATRREPCSRSDPKEMMFIERLNTLDEVHSQKTGLTMEDMNALARRIEMRTSNLVSAEPVCAAFAEKVVECYAKSTDPKHTVKCWEAIGVFSRCVQEAGASRLRERSAREARELTARERRREHAREHALRDLGSPPIVKSS